MARSEFPLNRLSETLKIFVPSATISVCDLDGSKISIEMAVELLHEEPPLLNELTNLPIVRTIGTDDVLAAALLWELWQRGVNRNLATRIMWWTAEMGPARERPRPGNLSAIFIVRTAWC